MTKEQLLEQAKPILFNTDMVRAILDNTKKATRRLIKPPYSIEDNGSHPIAVRIAPKGSGLYREIGRMPVPDKLYRVGDILYVRETWHKYTKRVGKGERCRLQEFYGYKASIANSEDANEKWRPSIHMPKAAARIFLEVTNVRVERLQDMDTEDDRNYIAEGMTDKHDFIRIWDSTVKEKDIYGWYANPWVWVIEFERVIPED